jgi:hypothetical protein
MILILNKNDEFFNEWISGKKWLEKNQKSMLKIKNQTILWIFVSIKSRKIILATAH